MAVKFPQGSIIALVDVTPDERITLADFEGSQTERESKFQQAVSFQRLHKKKLEREPEYDPSDPSGENTGIRVGANELREAFAEQPLITIPDTDDDIFVSRHLIIREFDLPTDETNAYYKEVIKLSRNFLTE
jgi:hypothetical protein